MKLTNSYIITKNDTGFDNIKVPRLLRAIKPSTNSDLWALNRLEIWFWSEHEKENYRLRNKNLDPSHVPGKLEKVRDAIKENHGISIIFPIDTLIKLFSELDDEFETGLSDVSLHSSDTNTNIVLQEGSVWILESKNKNIIEVFNSL